MVVTPEFVCLFDRAPRESLVFGLREKLFTFQFIIIVIIICQKSFELKFSNNNAFAAILMSFEIETEIGMQWNYWKENFGFSNRKFLIWNINFAKGNSKTLNLHQ